MIRTEFSSFMRTLFSQMTLEDVQDRLVLVHQGEECHVEVNQSGQDVRVGVIDSYGNWKENWVIGPEMGTFDVSVCKPSLGTSQLRIVAYTNGSDDEGLGLDEQMFHRRYSLFRNLARR